VDLVLWLVTLVFAIYELVSDVQLVDLLAPLADDTSSGLAPERAFLKGYIVFVNISAVWNLSSGGFAMWFYKQLTVMMKSGSVDKSTYREVRRAGRQLLNFVSWTLSTLTFTKLIVIASIGNKLSQGGSVMSAQVASLQRDMVSSCFSLFKSLIVFVMFTFFDSWASRLRGARFLPLLVALFLLPVFSFLSFYYTQQFFVALGAVALYPIQSMALSSAVVSIVAMAILLLMAPVAFSRKRVVEVKQEQEPVESATGVQSSVSHVHIQGGPADGSVDDATQRARAASIHATIIEHGGARALVVSSSDSDVVYVMVAVGSQLPSTITRPVRFLLKVNALLSTVGRFAVLVLYFGMALVVYTIAALALVTVFMYPMSSTFDYIAVVLGVVFLVVFVIVIRVGSTPVSEAKAEDSKSVELAQPLL
jgi:membrane protein implicated in regulation of membrane protease activity